MDPTRDTIQLFFQAIAAFGAIAGIARLILDIRERKGTYEHNDSFLNVRIRETRRSSWLSVVSLILFFPLSFLHQNDRNTFQSGVLMCKATIATLVVPVMLNGLLATLLLLKGLDFNFVSSARSLALILSLALVGGFGFLFIRGPSGYSIGVVASGIPGGVLLGSLDGVFRLDFGMIHLGIIAFSTGNAFGTLGALLERENQLRQASPSYKGSNPQPISAIIGGFLIGMLLGFIFNLALDVVKGVDFSLFGYILGSVIAGTVAASVFGVMAFTTNGKNTGFIVSGIFATSFGSVSGIWLDNPVAGISWFITFGVLFIVGYFGLIIYPLDLIVTQICRHLSRRYPLYAFRLLPIYSHHLFWYHLYGLDDCFRALLESGCSKKHIDAAIRQVKTVFRQEWIFDSRGISESVAPH